MKEKEMKQSQKYKTGLFLITSLATFLLLKKKNYQAALLFYKAGGGGLNIYKVKTDNKTHRCFAIDYHPFWNKQTNRSEWKVHYHRGKNYQQIKKHRPYEGGW